MLSAAHLSFLKLSAIYHGSSIRKRLKPNAGKYGREKLRIRTLFTNSEYEHSLKFHFVTTLLCKVFQVAC